jgi:hypothetical protein
MSESTLERGFFLVKVEWDWENVLKYEEQPVAIEFFDEGMWKKYVPDCLITYKPEAGRKPLLVEIKRLEDLDRNKAKYEPKFAAARKYAAEHEMEFKIFTEFDFIGPLLENVKMLYHFARPTSHVQEYQEFIFAKLRASGPMSVLRLINEMEKEGYLRANVFPVLWHLVFQKKIRMDLQTLINNSSVLILPG